MKKCVGGLMACVVLYWNASGFAQSVVITSFSRNGILAWQAPTNSISTIEWSGTLAPTGTWHRDWLGLAQRASTNGIGSAAVPVFYRVSCWTNGLFIQTPIGRTYTYAASNALGGTWTETIHIAGMASVLSAEDNYVIADAREHYSGPAPAGAPEDELFIMRSTDSKVYGFGGVGREFLVWQDAPVGTTWTNDSKVSEIVARESVTLPIGSFEDCVVIQRTDTNSPPPNNTLTEWINPGFFMVKWVDYCTDPGAATPVLYTLSSWEDE